MIVRNEYKGDLALGKRLKTTIVSALDSATESAGLLADGITTLRSTIETIYLQVEGMNIEQRGVNYALAQSTIKQLVANGASEQEACEYLQVPYVAHQPLMTVSRNKLKQGTENEG